MNVVVLRGTVASDPHIGPHGSVQLEVVTPLTIERVTVPVVSHEQRDMRYLAGTEVVVVGYVRRRFFRAGGVTQSRTEVVGEVYPASSKVRVERAIDATLADMRRLAP